jgi:DNA-binding transcriptional LysR family regulator
MWTDLSVRQLLAFRAVVAEGTFGKAATRLGFSQSAVSQQVATLEQHTGHRLFDRPAGPHRPRLTPAGEILLAHTDLLLAQIGGAEADLARLEQGIIGRLKIGTFQSITTRILPMALQRLTTEAPDIEIVLIEDDPDNDFRQQALIRGDIDLAFIDGDVLEHLDLCELGSDPHVALLPPDAPPGPISLSEVAQSAMVGQPADDSCGLLVDRGLERLGLTPRYAYRSHDNAAIQALVGAGVGNAIVPLLTVDTSDPNVAVRATIPALEPRQLRIAWDPERTLPQAAHRFVEIAASACADQLSDF